MNRKMALLVAATLTLGCLAGCGEVKQEKAVSPESTVEQAEQPSEEKTETAESASGEEEQKECPRIKFTNLYPELNTTCFSAWSVRAEVENECYSQLNDSMKEVFDKDYQDFLGYLDQAVKDSEEYNANLDQVDGSITYFTDFKRPSIKRCDSKVVAIDLEEYLYSGGAHGTSADTVYNFDTQSGQLLKFEDLGDIATDVKDFVLTYIASNEELSQSVFEEYKDTIETDFANNSCTLPFYLDGRGLTIIFPQYEIAPYATGKILISVPYDRLTSLEKKYIPDEDFYTIDLEEYWADNSVDVNGDGKEEAISIQLQYNENYEYVIGATLTVGDKQVVLGDEAFSHENYEGLFVHKDNCNYVFVKTSDSGDWQGLMIYDVSGEPKLLQELDLGIKQMYYDLVVLETRVDIFGTYGVERDYTYDENAGLVPVSDGEDCYRITGEPRFDEEYGHITVQKAFTDADGNEVAVGTKLYPVFTNNDGIITMTTPEDKHIRIKYECNDGEWERWIDGVKETEIFGDMIPYAG